MEAVALPYSPDQAISPYKQTGRNSKRNVYTTVPLPLENFSPANLLVRLHGRGPLTRSPQYLSSSLSFSLSNAQKQPPLLPLPINYKPCSRNRGASCPPTNRKKNKTRDQDLKPKKSKPKKQDSRSVPTECLVITSTDRLGPEPSDLPGEVWKVMKQSVPSEKKKKIERFSGSSVFDLSPPPSSLPLPKFSLRSKLSCNAEAGGIDTGATDNLRRLLRLD